MKFTLPTLLSLAALASVSIATTCQGTYDSGVTNRYIVHASGVTDIPGICGGLWDNLKRYGVCAATQTFCGQDGGTEDMRWEFVASAGCDNGMVDAAWWDATKNAFGSISCPEPASS
ncbi:hypothetical protein BP5796_12335 [Coleophoma crateriformis]|uniref:Uncharacterized protein n=1 Tax=Coleophoma crateriformis TaxID=565419 RepID=A0A3D8Q985_9HELO|nr:hypothetical protein BP5796_12335 [Coleophoma crateriformis]